MNKQIVGIISIVISLGFALGIYLYFFEIKQKSMQPILVVPDDAAIVIESNQSSKTFAAFTHENFFLDLLKNDQFNAAFTDLLLLDSLIQTNKTIRSWFAEGEATYSFHPFQNHKVGFLLTVQTGKEPDAAQVLHFFEENFPSRFQVSKRKFNGIEVYDLTDFQKAQHLSIAFNSKLLLFSMDGVLIESALLKIASNVVENSDNQMHVLSAITANKQLNVYLNYSNLPLLFNAVAPEDQQHSFSIVKNFAEKAVYQVNATGNTVQFTGAAVTHRKAFQFLDLLNGLSPAKNELIDLLPDNIYYAFTFVNNGYQSWNPVMKEYLQSKQLMQRYQFIQDSLEGIYGIKFSKAIPACLGNQFTMSALSDPNLWKDSSYFFAIQMQNAVEFERILMKVNQHQKDSLLSDTAKNNELNPIIQFPLGDFFKLYFGDLFADLPVSHCVRKGNFFFFANHKSVLQVLIEKWNQNEVLSQVSTYENFKPVLNQNFNFQLLVNGEIAPRYLMEFVNQHTYGLIGQNISTLKKARWIGLQYAGSTDKVFPSQGAIQFKDETATKTEKLWELKLDTALQVAPSIVFHTGIGSNCIMVQDGKNQVYLIDPDGKIHWKVKVDDKLVSRVHTTDFYHTGKHQYVFNTSHNIYAIDENGKLLSGFPLWIPTATQYPLSLLDDPMHPGETFIFVVGRYFKISGYNSQGRLIEGWNPLAIFPNAKGSLQQFDLGKQHLYCVVNEKGGISYFQPNGKSVNFPSPDSSSQWFDVSHYQSDTGVVQFFTLDSTALTCFNLTPNKALIQTQVKFEKAHQFQVLNTTADNAIVLLNGSATKRIQQLKGKVLFQGDFPETQFSDLALIPLSNAIGFSYYDKIKKSVVLKDITGRQTLESFDDSDGNYLLGKILDDASNWFIGGTSQGTLEFYKVR